MVEKLVLDLTVAQEIEIKGISLKEKGSFAMVSETPDWVGNYIFTVYNSNVKNSAKVIPSAFTVTADKKQGILSIDPTAQAIAIGKHYYEIFDTTSQRIEIFGDLIINK